MKVNVEEIKVDVSILKADVREIRKDVNDLTIITQLDEIRKDHRLAKVFRIQA
ncbi:MAG: hypothetical protein HC859_03110 [Bacteroidia bacterium]|nr:hypothetical protein [Bacteroidia bacterium]